MSNRLANETSPYLLQHAENPVDWYAWGEEAFAKARAEDKPVLLSVGYSSCHWCHVMAHESFEDQATAAKMNDWFVNVKVDREERPDIDGVYMTAVQAITGQGGWPMTVFMTADGKPFYAGTYFPPEDSHGRPGFPRVLEALHDAWTTEREKLLNSAEGITDHLRSATARMGAGKGTTQAAPEMSDAAVRAFRQAFDADWGGFGQAPKFPSPGNLDFLLQYGVRTGDQQEPSAFAMTLLTLVRMASGGMYDQLGGGFARYSVDRYWLVPHFEKMLYDNAQLVRVYLHAYQLTGEPFYQRIVRETLGYLQREMLDAEGGFYSAQDADSEGIEGKFFVWTPDEVRDVLGDDAELFNTWFSVTEAGNFRDPHHPDFGSRNVLTTWSTPAEVAEKFGRSEADLAAKIGELRVRMFEERDKRTHPGLDDKVLTSWNGLALGAFAEAARILGDDSYREVAERNAAFVREALWQEGRLLHTYKAGQARVDGLIEDYAYYGLGLVELYKLTGDISHLEWARELLDVLMRDFRDAEGGGFFETPEHGEELLIRQKSFFDAASPSGNGATALLALWLARYYGKPEWEAVAQEVLGQVQELLSQAPTGFGTILQCVEFLLSPPRELVVVGDAEGRVPFEREIARYFLPWVALAPTSGAQGLPMFEGRESTDGAAAYLCENMVCNLPARSPEELSAQMRAAG